MLPLFQISFSSSFCNLNFQYTASLVPTLNTLKEKDETKEYKGDELGEDILSIPLDDPAANAAASKIQVRTRLLCVDCRG